MSGHTNQVIEDFDFTDALRLRVDERMKACVSLAEQRLTDRGLLDIFLNDAGRGVPS